LVASATRVLVTTNAPSVRDRNEKESKLFDVLQEKSSRDEYGIVLDCLVCFYLRNLREEMELDSESEYDLDSFRLRLATPQMAIGRHQNGQFNQMVI
jgi:hypothetical protein